MCSAMAARSVRVFQPLDDLRGAAIVGLRRHAAQHERASGRVRVELQSQVDLGLGIVELLHEFGHLPGVVHRRARVREVDLHARASSDLQRLRHAASAEPAVGVHVAQVSRVDTVELGDDLAQLYQLLGGAPSLRVVRHARRETDGSLLHSLPHEALGVFEPVSHHRNVTHSAGLHPKSAVRDVGHDVDCRLLVVVLAEGRDRAHVQVVGRSAENTGEVVVVHPVVFRRGGHVRQPVLSEDLGGDPLPEALRVLPVDQEHGVGVDVRVDEPRRDDVPRRVDDALTLRLRQVAYGLDLLAHDTEIGPVPRLPRAVHNRPARYENVEHSISSVRLFVESRRTPIARGLLYRDSEIPELLIAIPAKSRVVPPAQVVRAGYLYWVFPTFFCS